MRQRERERLHVTLTAKRDGRTRFKQVTYASAYGALPRPTRPASPCRLWTGDNAQARRCLPNTRGMPRLTTYFYAKWTAKAVPSITLTRRVIYTNGSEKRLPEPARRVPSIQLNIMSAPHDETPPTNAGRTRCDHPPGGRDLRRLRVGELSKRLIFHICQIL
jgi:hypothetical protein